VIPPTLTYTRSSSSVFTLPTAKCKPLSRLRIGKTPSLQEGLTLHPCNDVYDIDVHLHHDDTIQVSKYVRTYVRISLYKYVYRKQSSRS